MGKPEELPLGIREDLAGGDTYLRRACSVICCAVTPRCVAVLLLSVFLLVSVVFWLPPLNFLHHAHGGADADDLAAEIQASFILQKPKSILSAYTERLEYDIFEEIGVPNSKVCIISMNPLAPANSTYVVFGVLPDSKTAPISTPALSLLRSSFIELVLEQLNLSLTPSIFGHVSSFEVLRFPGGITVIPVQSASIWERTQTLFHFRLNNSIFQIQKNLDELKNQLKFGLHLRPYENVYVQMTNGNGSTAAPPVTVKASVLSDVGSRILLPDRLKQLAQLITGSHAKNLGLNHSIFGRVKQVRLSSYLEHSISSGESPTPSPSPCPSPSPSPYPYPCPTPSPSPYPSLTPSPYPSPSSTPSPSPYPSPSSTPSPYPSPTPSRSPYPSLTPSPYPSPSSSSTPSPSSYPSPSSTPSPSSYPSPSSTPSLSPSPFRYHYPYRRIPSHPRGVSPARQPFPHTPTTPDKSPGPERPATLSPRPSYSSSPPQGEPPMSASPPSLPSQSSRQPFPHTPTTPDKSPGPERPTTLSPRSSYSSSPPQGEPPMSASPPSLPSQSSHVGPHLYTGIWLIVLIVLVFHQLHESN